MPGMDGLSLCRAVREHEKKPDTSFTYFILLTGLDDMTSRFAGMTAGADDYLTKPVNKDDLALRLVAAQRAYSQGACKNHTGVARNKPP